MLDDLTSTDPSLDGLQRQGVAHIPVTAEQVLQNDGGERWKWMQAGRQELDNLSSTGTTESMLTNFSTSFVLFFQEVAFC